MDPTDPEFLAWAKRFGYVPWEPLVHQREAFFRHWVAWKAGIPPACPKAHRLLKLSGLLRSLCPPH